MQELCGLFAKDMTCPEIERPMRMEYTWKLPQVTLNHVNMQWLQVDTAPQTQPLTHRSNLFVNELKGSFSNVFRCCRRAGRRH